MTTWDTKNSSLGNERSKEVQQNIGNGPGIEEQTIKIVLIEIMVAIVINIQDKGMGELEFRSSASNPRDGVIVIVSNSFKLQKRGFKTGLSPKSKVRQVNKKAKMHKKAYPHKHKGNKKEY